MMNETWRRRLARRLRRWATRISPPPDHEPYKVYPEKPWPPAPPPKRAEEDETRVQT